jgi:hypothetical protein
MKVSWGDYSQLNEKIKFMFQNNQNLSFVLDPMADYDKSSAL